MSSLAKPLSLTVAAFGGAALGAAGVLLVQRTAAVAAVKQPGQERKRLFVGVDIGGTTISVGIVSDDGVLQGAVQTVPLGEDHAPQTIVTAVASLVRAAMTSTSLPITVHDFHGIGVCSPGLLDCERGVVAVAANLKGWRDVPITKLVADALGVRRDIVFLENDANTALLAEVWIGSAKGMRNVVLLTLGTGIGAGILVDGHLLRGWKGYAGELGHSILVPDGRTHGTAGVDGILEGYASATAVVARAKEGGAPSNSALHGLESFSCKDVFMHAAQGDKYAAGIVSETARFLAIGCINCSRSYDPEVILFTGGMSQAGEQLLSQVRTYFGQYHWNIMPVSLELKLAASPANAGLIGAAYAARSAIGGK